MKVVSFALVYLASVSVFGVKTAKLDVASDFKRRWSKWAVSRVRRDLTSAAALLSTGQAADANVPSVIRTQDVKGESGMAQPSRPEVGRIRVKRYRQSVNSGSSFQALRIGCRLGTCNTHNLQQKIFHLNDKDKDSHHPPRKISAHGYGRRRRSLADIRARAPSAASQRSDGVASSSSSSALSRLVRALAAQRPARPSRSRLLRKI
ncbi:pro-adrenomedullin [Varanus komodoensis]|uniref:Pro-adrenomedullin n=1 Tax=Varanus komodoensis TaxID=61221 RepID=A0A8D2LIE0_VARKO|nr:pro-adrenomedullin [Varanus komodoensis]